LEGILLEANRERASLAAAREQSDALVGVLREKAQAAEEASRAEESHLRHDAESARRMAAEASDRAERFRRDARTILRRAAELAARQKRGRSVHGGVHGASRAATALLSPRVLAGSQGHG